MISAIKLKVIRFEKLLKKRSDIYSYPVFKANSLPDDEDFRLINFHQESHGSFKFSWITLKWNYVNIVDCFAFYSGEYCWLLIFWAAQKDKN